MSDQMDVLKVDWQRNTAIALIRAKFDGLIPETLTAKECCELMLQFGDYASMRADCAEKLMVETLNTKVNWTWISGEAK